jgi:hypothetical protein
MAVTAFNTLICPANSHGVASGNNEFHTKDILFLGIIGKGGRTLLFFS